MSSADDAAGYSGASMAVLSCYERHRECQTSGGFSNVTNELLSSDVIIRQSSILTWSVLHTRSVACAEQPRKTIAQLVWEATSWLNISQSEMSEKGETRCFLT